MTLTERETYRIGCDTLPDGRIRAKARGTKKNTRTTQPSTLTDDSTAHHDAALALALVVEKRQTGVIVERRSFGTGRQGEPASDWAVLVEEPAP